MALTLIENLVLWGVPVLSIVITVLYYLRWGKEPDERRTVSDENGKVGE